MAPSPESGPAEAGDCVELRLPDGAEPDDALVAKLRDALATRLGLDDGAVRMVSRGPGRLVFEAPAAAAPRLLEDWAWLADPPYNVQGVRLLHPYIAGQRALLLMPAGDVRDYLKPEQFHQGRHWRPYPRAELFFRRRLKRLCVTTDAGVGKTTTLRWIEWQAPAEDPLLLAVYLRLSDLPEDPAGYLSSPETSPLVHAFRVKAGVGQVGPREAAALLRRLLAQGRLLLLLDGLDQTRTRGGAGRNPRVTALRRFLEGEGRQCRVIVAGRPHAVLAYWPDLFQDGGWSFARVEEFTPEQQRNYLGEERWQRLRQIDMAVLAIPRALEAIRRLALQKLDDLRTAGDVYWECVGSLLNEGVNIDAFAGERAGRVEKFRRLLAALAFEMVRDGNFQDVGPGEARQFLFRVWKNQAAAGEDLGW
jgi:hypothetical protein